MARICGQCGKAPGVVNLNTAQRVDGGGPGPDMWVWAACLAEGISSPGAQAFAQADQELDEHRKRGGHLN
jgi:hypothetical protein